MMRRPLTFILLSVSLSLAGFAACAVPTGQSVAVEVFARAAPQEGETSAATFLTATGWRVELREAWVALGPLFVFGQGDSVAVLRELLLPVAHAHGGDGLGSLRPLRAELSEQRAVDLLAGATSLGTARGSVGYAVDATLLLDAPRGALADSAGPLRGHHVWLAGVARREGQEINFEGGIDIPDEGTARLIEGMPLEAFVEQGGRLELAAYLPRWLDRAHFDRLPVPVASEATRVLAPGTQAHSAVYLGVRSAEAFSITWIEPNEGSL